MGAAILFFFFMSKELDTSLSIVHIDAAMNNSTTTALRAERRDLQDSISLASDEPSAFSANFEAGLAKMRVEAIDEEIALREEAEERDRMDYLDTVEASNGR